MFLFKSFPRGVAQCAHCTMQQFLKGRQLGRSDDHSQIAGGSAGRPAPGWEVWTGPDKEVDTRH